MSDWWPTGAERRAWLDRQDERLTNALSYYLGPAAQPVNALASVAGALSPGADLVDAYQYGRETMQAETPLNALAGLGMTGAAMLGMAAPGSVRGYHASFDQFDNYDWGRLGRFTDENSGSEWADNLARVGPWASSHADMAERMAVPHTIAVDVSGKAKRYQSLDALEAAVRRAGGPEALRDRLRGSGYGHVRVADEEFGGTSYVGLSPETWRIAK